MTWALYPTDCTIFPPQSTAILCGEKLSSRRGKPCFPFDMKQDYVYAMSYALYPHDSLPSFLKRRDFMVPDSAPPENMLWNCPSGSEKLQLNL